MKCRQCGADIPDGVLRCRKCGTEVRIVPDYNPLDEVLAAQIKGSIDGSGTPLDDYEYQTSRDIRGGSRNGRTSQVSGKTRITPEQKRRQAERRKALKKKKRIRMLILLGIIVVLAVIFGVIFYQFSYTGQVNKGYKALEDKNYTEAEEYFTKALNKKPKKAKAYYGIQELYIATGEEDKAEEILLNAIDQYPDQAEIYEAAFSFYIEIEKQTEIPIILDNAPDSVIDAFPEYYCETPDFSLSDDETYEDVQQLSLESAEEKIYYTTDESDPFSSNTRIEYEEPIQISKGENTIKAIAVNEMGIPSLTVTKTYVVELPIEDAPAVSPSTGQYDSETTISIIVPDGYTAYYTMDSTDPTEESEEYTGPIQMPEGSTIFKAVLLGRDGRLSGITTRNYELVLE